MKRDLRAEIRALLLARPDGLTTRDLVVATKASDKSVRHSLGSMPDVYIDRWEFPRQGPLAAVYCAVEVPEDCPRPARAKRTEEELKEYHRAYTAGWHAAKKAEETPRQGLTTIRGPWPTQQDA
jgi:hypothetical protein